MVKYKRNIRAASELVAARVKDLMGNLSRDLIGLLGSLLLLIFVLASGVILAFDNRMGRA
jgi:hypothetical protein